MLIFTQALKNFSGYSTNDHEVGQKNYSFENLVDKRSIKMMISYVPNEILPMKNIGCLLISDSRIPPLPSETTKYAWCLGKKQWKLYLKLMYRNCPAGLGTSRNCPAGLGTSRNGPAGLGTSC